LLERAGQLEKTRLFKSFRDPVSGLTHFFAAIAAAGGLAALLVVSWGHLARQLSLSVYGVSLLLMFSASAAYHLPRAAPQTIQWLRKLDHSAIYTLIAGTYTPVCYNLFTGFWQWGLLAVIWSLAAIGVIVKLWIIQTPRWLTAGVYVAMGWLSLAAIGEMLHVLPVGALAWLFAGGLVFTFGAIVYVTRIMNFFPGVFGFHEVWHVFVILGCLCHFIAILVYVAVGTRMT
jgi:hemolysin III